MQRILFVCLGNICRSPTAEAVLRGMALREGVQLVVDSAGTAAYHAGESPDPRTCSSAAQRGYDMQGQFARQVRVEDFRDFDFVFAMDRQNLLELQKLKAGQAGVNPELFLQVYGGMGINEVPDPYYGGQWGFENVLDLLEDACARFLKALKMANITANKSLLEMNTLAINAKARYLAEAECMTDVHEIMAFAKRESLPLFVMGGGSNLILADEIQGVVLRYVAQQVQVLKEDDLSVVIRVDAGVMWHQLVMHTLAANWYGLENLALIPGTAGAAPVQNIGAYGVEVESFIELVEGLDLLTGELRTYSHDECKFAYRDSIFKHALRDKFLITAVQMRLSKSAAPVLSYAPLADRAKTVPGVSPVELAQWVIELRSSKLPDPAVLPNAGSFFKNPVLTQDQYQDLKTRFPDLPAYPSGEAYKVPAAWLIDRMGLKGERIGLVEVNRLQPLVLINHGGNGADVLHAAHEIQRKILQQFSVELEIEPQTLP
ncbi:MAG: UDP-N-acetylmuramate dehydrogenase [Oceanospirillaceae bacterium]|nr:UDP-N-acetylmuramate dehydrogenase [Oceanospirillaceae bacterium]